MIYLLLGLLFIMPCISCMDKDSKKDKELSNLFANLFPGTEEEPVASPEKTRLPLEKITIEKDMMPLLEQSRVVLSEMVNKKIEFITSGLAHKQNLEIITPYMLIFGKNGVGKSTLALSVAQIMQKKAGWTIYRLESTDLATEFQNSGPQTINKIGQKLLKKKKGAILITEDINGFYPHYQSGDTNDSGANAIAWWQFLDQIQNNPAKNVLVLATESNTDMPNQTKERLGHAMIALKSLTMDQIEQYVTFKLKQQPSVQEFNDRARNECMQQLAALPDISYSILERFMQQAIRESSSRAFKECRPYTFRLADLISVIKDQKKTPEYTLLKMDQEYESEQERLHKKQIAQQKQFHEEQQALSELQLQYSYNQMAQQLVYNAALDYGGYGPKSGEPKELLDEEQYQLYENAFVKNVVPNNISLMPSVKAAVPKQAMTKLREKLGKLHYDKKNN